MKNLLREYIRSFLIEAIDVSDLTDVCYAGGSTHILQTCKIGGDEFFLKFSEPSLFYNIDPSMQILTEYLAYAVYSLYEGVNIPDKIHLVYDQNELRVAIATSPARGKQGFTHIDPRRLAKMMSKGVYVDIFLANWDVIGTGTGNVFVDGDEVTRIDPAAFNRRAQGGEKSFDSKVGELKTMTKAGFGAGNVYQYADLKEAAQTFKSVPWGQIAGKLDKINEEILSDLNVRGYDDLLNQWMASFKKYKNTLNERHKTILGNIGWVENNS
jgi:hypothetical protein